MKTTKRKLVYAFLLGILFGMISFVGLWGIHRDAPPIVRTDDPSHLRSALSATEQHYRNRIDSIDRANASLQAVVSKTAAALAQVRQQNRQLQGRVKNLLIIQDTATDTTVRLDNCDSLALAVDYLIAQTTTKDSLYETLTGSLQEQLALRDSVNHLKQEQYDSLQVSYGKALVQQAALQQENTSQRKTIRHQKRGKGLLTVLLTIVGGLFAYQTIK